jgi:hypothetical protein
VGTEIEIAPAQIELTPEQIAEAAERWPEHPEAEQRRRMNLSLIAKARHAQVADPTTGRRVFGGVQPGSGRKSKKRAAEAIAELAQGTRQKEVIDALFSGLDKGNSAAVRVATANKIVAIEREERELQLKEDEFDGQPKEELKGIVLKGLMRMVKQGDLSMSDIAKAAMEEDAEQNATIDLDPSAVHDAA